jgi:uncharacterized protein DUF2846
MYKKLLLVILVSSLFVGCASVPMESTEKNEIAKSFNPPTGDNAGLYIYRSGSFGGALKKDIWINEKCVGESAPDVFFFEEVQGGKEHKISTESEFSPNDIFLKTDSGKNYFVQQYIKLGLFVHGAGLELVDEATGKKEIERLSIAKKGVCSSGYAEQQPQQQ